MQKGVSDMKFFIYKNFNNKFINNLVSSFENPEDRTVYTEVLSELLEETDRLELKGNVFKRYICYLLAVSENPFTLMAEKQGFDTEESLKELVLEDIGNILKVLKMDIFNINYRGDSDKSYDMLYNAMDQDISAEDFLNILIKYYETYGCGEFCLYPAFKWSAKKGLVGISKCDPIKLDNLIGCDYQKNAIIKNTENFLQGKQANNALLFGDSGTGKSSMVKAILNEYYDKGLRMIELSKADFSAFNEIVPRLRKRGLCFIIFLDDLSFEEFEIEYKYMKALIEGGIEVKPQNVIIYATSNRRHLIRETWDERQGQDVNINDTRQEKLSLADRFGLSLTFTSPMQNGYLEIVKSLAKEYEIKLDENTLREKAIQWELSHGGRSGRVAKQFILSLL